MKIYIVQMGDTTWAFSNEPDAEALMQKLAAFELENFPSEDDTDISVETLEVTNTENPSDGSGSLEDFFKRYR